MRLIDADAKELEQKINVNFGSATRFSMKNILKEAPTVDAVVVVRCKDCKFASDLDTDESAWCKNWNQYVWAEHFCSYGERKGGAYNGR